MVRQSSPVSKGQFELILQERVMSWRCESPRRGVTVWELQLSGRSGVLLEIEKGTDSELNRLLRSMLRAKGEGGFSPSVTYHNRAMIYNGHLCLFYQGLALGPSVSAFKKLTPVEVTKLYYDILKGLEHLHQKGLHHGALSPAGIFLNSQGDFTITGEGLGYETPSYLRAPESFTSKAGDIWSLSAMVFLLLVRHAKQHALRDLSTRLCNKDFISTAARMLETEGYPTTPGTLGYLVLSGLAPEPSRRPSSDYIAKKLEDLSNSYAQIPEVVPSL
eukprot:TRINITY_DN42162_c0_g1_i1.p1 TRINITY_DN42162_c0_g1~~TRINITY_DN42162_c0_g1_i1.p1  ORF type:complete len:287 (+),score=56.69 TRINITY_DN42162_c0_g1_i1:37-861(+)